MIMSHTDNERIVKSQQWGTWLHVNEVSQLG